MGMGDAPPPPGSLRSSTPPPLQRGRYSAADARGPLQRNSDAARSTAKGPFRQNILQNMEARRPDRENPPTPCFSRPIAGNGSRKAVQKHKDFYPFMRDFASQSARRSGPSLSRKASQCKALPEAPQRRGRPSRQFLQKMERSVQFRGTGQVPVFSTHSPESKIERLRKNESRLSRFPVPAARPAGPVFCGRRRRRAGHRGKAVGQKPVRVQDFDSIGRGRHLRSHLSGCAARGVR